MIAHLLSSGYIDERIAEAMRKVPREFFVPEIYKRHAYADHPIPIGSGQTISAPSIVGIMTKELDVRSGMKILEVGSGSGWQCAILAVLANPGIVYTIERIPELLENARRNVEKIGLKNIEFIYGDGSKGYPDKAPFDRIMVTAAAPKIPNPLVEQLANGGRMVIPVGTAFWQDLYVVEKINGRIKTRRTLPVVFVPLIGEYGFDERDFK